MPLPRTANLLHQVKPEPHRTAGATRRPATRQPSVSATLPRKALLSQAVAASQPAGEALGLTSTVDGEFGNASVEGDTESKGKVEDGIDEFLA